MKAKVFLLGSIVATILLFCGCSKDTPSNTSLIVGTWFDHYHNGGSTEIFYKNGTWSHEDDFYSMHGTYSYDSSSRILVINVNPSANNGGGSKTCYVLSLTSTNLSYSDGGGTINNFVRIN